MTTEAQIAVEPVTERDIDEVLNARAAGYDIRYALEQDRRRVAERQVSEIERLRAEVAAHRKHDVLRCDALMKAEAEVAKLNAACAAKDAVIRLAFATAKLPKAARDAMMAALPDDAGRNWIDATGAVEAAVQRWEVRGAFGYFIELSVPDDWAGSRVLIVRVP